VKPTSEVLAEKREQLQRARKNRSYRKARYECAVEALHEAMSRGAPPAELKRLRDRLRNAKHLLRSAEAGVEGLADDVRRWTQKKNREDRDRAGAA
jgi:uncharacterized protein YPO0396